MIVLSDALIALLGDSAGGDRPIFGADNKVTISNVVADQEDADYPATNLANPATYLLWKSGSTADQYLTVTLSGSEPIDYVGLARHNLGSGGVVVSVEGITAEVGATWEELDGEQLLPDDAPAMFLFEPAYLVGVRLKFQPDATAPQAAVLYTGKSLIMAKGLQPGHTPLKFGRTQEMTSGISQSGEFLGNIITGQNLSTSIQFRALDGSWYRTNMQPFVEACRDPFFFAWRPVSSPYEVGYAFASSNPQPVQAYMGRDLIDISIDMDGLSL